MVSTTCFGSNSVVPVSSSVLGFSEDWRQNVFDNLWPAFCSQMLPLQWSRRQGTMWISEALFGVLNTRRWRWPSAAYNWSHCGKPDQGDQSHDHRRVLSTSNSASYIHIIVSWLLGWSSTGEQKAGHEVSNTFCRQSSLNPKTELDTPTEVRQKEVVDRKRMIWSLITAPSAAAIGKSVKKIY